jgi:hypothetical protein
MSAFHLIALVQGVELSFWLWLLPSAAFLYGQAPPPGPGSFDVHSNSPDIIDQIVVDGGEFGSCHRAFGGKQLARTHVR